MKTINLNKKLFLFLFVVVFFATTAVSNANSGMNPSLNNGKKWRVGYYEGGEYIDYQKIFIETIKGLMKLGWIESTDIPPQSGEQTIEIWKWLNENAKSDFISFVYDAHYCANWDDKTREKTAEKVVERLSNKKDLDLIIAMGTWAGKDLANSRHGIPTEVISASDPIASGIIKSVEDSGYDHVHAQIDPFRYERQLRVFHDMIGFKKIGVCYEDTAAGRSYAAIEKLEKVAQERNFEIVRAFTKSDVADTKLAEESVKEAFQKLAQDCDAIYVTVQGGVNYRSIPELVKIVNTHKIPTFSQSGSEEVKYGFLASISQAGFKYIGEYHASIISSILSGIKPRSLPQLFEEPPKIAINMKTSEIIGFNPPVDILLAADEIYQDIQIPN